MVNPAEEQERPKAVTVIGRVWLVLAGILMLKALVNLVTWSILHLTAPDLMQAFGEHFAHVPLVQWILRHAGTVMVGQAAFWMLVGLCAWSFLRLRPWARAALQAVCCLGLCYATGVLVLWVELWRNEGFAMKDPSLTDAKRSLALFAGVAVWVLVGSLFGVMLGFLRSPRVREAFTPAS